MSELLKINCSVTISVNYIFNGFLVWMESQSKSPFVEKSNQLKKKKGLNSKWSSPWLALTYSLAHSSCGVHLVAIVTLTFVSSFKIYTYLTAYTRVEAFIDICGEIFIVLVPVEEHSTKIHFQDQRQSILKSFFWLHLNSMWLFIPPQVLRSRSWSPGVQSHS